MASEWTEVQFGSLCDISRGASPRPIQEWIAKEGIPWVKIADASSAGSRYIQHTKECIRTEGRSKSVSVVPGDLILSNSATPGIPMFMGIEACVHDGWLLLRNFRGLDKLFAYYLLLHERPALVAKGNGSVFTNLKTEILRNHKVVLPPLSIQRAIAHILGTLDDKIELNRRMNETLEAMARALFKSWFIDFDPVHAKAEGLDPSLPADIAALFPDSFQDSELGPIPAGWSVGAFDTVVENIREPENPMLSPQRLFQHCSIPAFDEGRSPRLEYGEAIKSVKWRVPRDAVLVSKLNPEIERVWLPDIRLGEVAVCSTEFLCLSARPPFMRGYIYCLARSPIFRQQLESMVTGTSKSHQRAQVDSILNLPVIVPPPVVLDAFDHFSASLLARTLECRQMSGTLAALRDTLLPKLLSGELRVNGVSQPVGAYQ